MKVHDGLALGSSDVNYTLGLTFGHKGARVGTSVAVLTFGHTGARVGTSVAVLTFRHARALGSASVEGAAIPVGSFSGTGSSTFFIYASTERISVIESVWVELSNPGVSKPLRGFVCTCSPHEPIVENSTELIRSSFAGLCDFHAGSLFIQGIHKRTVRFQKLTRNLFLTLHGHNVHHQQQKLSKFLMRYQQFAFHAYCGASFQDGVAAGHGFLCAPF